MAAPRRRRVSVAQTLDFQYQIASPGSITAINTPATGWLDDDALDFTSPTFGTTASAALDGNAAANRAARSAVLSITVANGQEIWLRWRDVDHAGNDHALAIDDLVDHGQRQRRRSRAHRHRHDAREQCARCRRRHPTSSINFSEGVRCRPRCVRARLRRAAVIYAERLARQCADYLNPDCGSALQRTMHGDGDGQPGHRRRHQRSARSDGGGLQLSFTTADPPLPGASVIINEIDADTPGNDSAEFVELFDGGVGQHAARRAGGRVLRGQCADGQRCSGVHKSYAAFDLDGYSDRCEWLLHARQPGVPGVDLVFNPASSACCRTAPTRWRCMPGTPATSRTEPGDHYVQRAGRDRLRHRRCGSTSCCCPC